MHVTPEEIWVAVGFVAFVGILIYKKVPGMVTALLDKRSVEIRTKLDEARQLRDEARELYADYERKLRDAQKEAADIVAQAETDAKVMARESRDAMEVALDRRAKLAKEKIEQARIAAEREVRRAAVDVASKAAERLIAQCLDASKSSALIDRAIKDLPGKLN
jgi:F-type H+-transporting ATPase subunit b